MLPGEEYQIYPVSGARRRPRGVKDETETRDLRGEGEMRKYKLSYKALRRLALDGRSPVQL